MADKSSFSGERSEEATPRRLEESRKKGQVGKSADLNSAINLCGILIVLFVLQGYIAGNIKTYYRDFFGHTLLAKIEDFPVVLLESGLVYFRVMAPIFLAAVIFGIISNFVQIGFLFTAETLKPKWERLNIVQGLQRMFSLKTLIELLKNIIKVTLVVTVVVGVIKRRIMSILSVSNADISQILSIGAKIVYSVTGAVIISYLAIAVFDLFYQKYQHKKGLRMTKQEVKDEFKQIEGNPQVKSKLKEKQRQLASRRMIQEVPKATVVVTNPTHYAVALKYDLKEMDAPFVVAKGADLLAERIKQIARENNVPMIENKPVAQFLYRHVEVGDAIPDELYQAIAEILAVVYQQKNKKF